MADPVGSASGVLGTSGRLGRRLGSTLLENVSWNEPGRCEHERGDDQGIIEMPDQGNEIRDQIDRAQRIRNGGT